MNYVKGREYLSDGITVNMLELRLLMGKVVQSLRSLVKQVRRKINGINTSQAMRKCVLFHMRTTKAQISLRSRAV